MNPHQPPPGSNLDEVRPDEALLLLAYRRCSERRQGMLRFLADYFAGGGDGDEPASVEAQIIQLEPRSRRD